MRRAGHKEGPWTECVEPEAASRNHQHRRVTDRRRGQGLTSLTIGKDAPSIRQIHRPVNLACHVEQFALLYVGNIICCIGPTSRLDQTLKIQPGAGAEPHPDDVGQVEAQCLSKQDQRHVLVVGQSRRMTAT